MKNKIENFFENKFLKNMTYIFSGTMIGSMLGLFNTGLLVKALGLEKNGIIFLGLSYAAFFNQLFNFQSYEAIIKFLPSCMDYGNEKGKNYIQQAIILDVGTAIAAFLVSYLLLDLSGGYFKWSGEVKGYIRILTVTILFTLTGAFRGVLRIFEKFKEISWINVCTNGMNTLFYLIGFILKLELIYYIFFTAISIFLSNLLVISYVWKTLKENGMSDLNFNRTRFDREFLKFCIYTNLSSTVDLPVFQITPFIINKYLGFSDVAVYKILEKIGGLITKVTSTMVQVLRPEISKRLSSGDEDGAYRIGFKIGKIVLGVGVMGFLFVALTHRYWLGHLIPNYENYMVSIYLYLFLTIFTEAFSGQHPIFIYSGHVKENTILLIVVNSIYMVILLYLTRLLGIK
ncbi:MAG: lipopolysaccharide biosynthesis protein [Fusobacteriaceae bacterium]